MTAILLVLAAISSVPSRPALAGPGQLAPGRITLRLSVDSSTTIPHGLVSLAITVKNISDEPTSGDFSLLSARVLMREPGGPFVPAYPEAASPDEPDDLILHPLYAAQALRTLEPGAEWTRSIVVGFDGARNAFLLSKPGEYELKASYFETRSRAILESDVIGVKVDALGANDRQAYEAFTPDLASIALGISAAPVAKLREARSFLDDFGSTPYASCLRTGLEAVLSGRSSSEERQLYRAVVAERKHRAIVPSGGKEREAMDALRPDLQLIASAGHLPETLPGAADERVFALPSATLLEAAGFLKRFGGTRNAALLRDGLTVVLSVKGAAGTRTVEETALFDKLRNERLP